MSELQQGLRRILADRHSPEAAAFYRTILGAIHRRLAFQASTRWRGVIGEPDQEEILGEVLFQLMQGSLARFRGETMPELMAFVRVMTDRITWKVVERRLRERDAMHSMMDGTVPAWGATDGQPTDGGVDFGAESPLPEADRAYLEALLTAGSKAELARAFDVSRAAVTQRVQRIQDRIQAMSSKDRAAHQSWMERTAAAVLDARPEPPRRS
jgi:hypothetical protein